MDKIDPDTKMPVLDKDGNVITEKIDVTIPMFRVVPVFDASQTEGEPLPELVEDLTGNVERYELFMDALKEVSPLPIEFENLHNGDGYCKYGDHIGIREGMSEIQTISTVIHEMVHAKLHDKNTLETAVTKSKEVKEIEAEGVSYAVCQY